MGKVVVDPVSTPVREEGVDAVLYLTKLIIVFVVIGIDIGRVWRGERTERSLKLALFKKRKNPFLKAGTFLHMEVSQTRILQPSALQAHMAALAC